MPVLSTHFLAVFSRKNGEKQSATVGYFSCKRSSLPSCLHAGLPMLFVPWLPFACVGHQSSPGLPPAPRALSRQAATANQPLGCNPAQELGHPACTSPPVRGPLCPMPAGPDRPRAFRVPARPSINGKCTSCRAAFSPGCAHARGLGLSLPMHLAPS